MPETYPQAETEQAVQAQYARALRQEKRKENQSDKISKTGQSLQTAGRGAEVAGKGMEASGKGMQVAGKGVNLAGQGLTQAGKGLSSTGAGAIVGAPLAVAGGGLAATGKGLEAAGRGAEKAGKAAQAAGRGLKDSQSFKRLFDKQRFNKLNEIRALGKSLSQAAQKGELTGATANIGSKAFLQTAFRSLWMFITFLPALAALHLYCFIHAVTRKKIFGDMSVIQIMQFIGANIILLVIILIIIAFIGLIYDVVEHPYKYLEISIESLLEYL